MKISFGINIFGSFKRQDLCIASLIRVSNKFESVKLYNIQLEGDSYENAHFETLRYPIRVAKDVVPGATMNMPMVKDFFDALACTDCDYFAFTNSDIIVHPDIIKLITDSDNDAIAVSRLAIHDIETLDEPATHEHYQIAGFDVFMVRRTWWLENRHRFPDYIYAISAWDVDYASRFAIYGDGVLYNTPKPLCYHIIHPEKSHDDSPERKHNVSLFFNEYKWICDRWHQYLFSLIEKRGKLDPNYMVPAIGEDEIYEQTFKKNIPTI